MVDEDGITARVDMVRLEALAEAAYDAMYEARLHGAKNRYEEARFHFDDLTIGFHVGTRLVSDTGGLKRDWFPNTKTQALELDRDAWYRDCHHTREQFDQRTGQPADAVVPLRPRPCPVEIGDGLVVGFGLRPVGRALVEESGIGQRGRLTAA